MNSEPVTFWLIANAVFVAMIALTWHAHRRFPHRLDRAGAIGRSSIWLLFALACSIGLVLG
jgi:hypothetical protein